MPQAGQRSWRLKQQVESLVRLLAFVSCVASKVAGIALAEGVLPQAPTLLSTPELARLYSAEWEVHLPVSEESGPYAPAILGTDNLMVVTVDRRLVCISPEDGTVRWSIPIELDAPYRPLLGTEIILLVSADGQLAAFDAESGRRLWERALGFSGLSSVGVSSGIVVSDTVDHRVIALQESDGEMIWERAASNLVQLSTESGIACLTENSKTLVGCQVSTGMKLWSIDFPGDPEASASSNHGIFFILDIDGRVLALDGHTGQVLWTHDCRLGSRSMVQSWWLSSTSNLLIVLGNMGLRGIQALDPMSGQLVWKSARFYADTEPRVLAHCLFDVGQGTVGVVDLSNGCTIQSLSSADRPYLLGSRGGSTYVAVPEAGIFRAKLQIGELHSFEAETGGLDKPIVSNILEFVLFVLLPLLLTFGSATVAFVRFGKPQIPSSSKTRMLQFLVGFAATTLFLLAFYMSALGLWYTLTRQFTWVSFGYSCSLGISSLCAILSTTALFNRPNRLTRSEPHEIDASERQLRKLQSLVEELATELGIKHPVPILFYRNNATPFVMRASWRNAQLILPGNFPQLVRRSCGGDRKLEQTLARFILAHELAHIRNGDLFVLSLASATRVSLVLLWIVPVVFYLADRFWVHDPVLFFLGQPLLGPLVLGIPFLLFVTRVLLRERERLADATASSCVIPEELVRVTGEIPREPDALPPLQRFILETTSFQTYHCAFHHEERTFDLSVVARIAAMIPRFAESIKRVTVSLRRRAQAIASKRDAIHSRSLPSFTDAVVIGIFLSLLFLEMLLVKHCIFITYLFLMTPRSPNSELGVYDALRTFMELYRQGPPLTLWEAGLGAVCGISGSAFLLLSLRDTSLFVGHSGVREFVSLSFRFVLAMGLCALLVTLVSSTAMLPLIPFLGMPIGAVLVGMAVSAIVFLLCLELRGDLSKFKPLFAFVIAAASASIFVVFVIGIGLFREIPLATRTTLICCSLMTWFYFCIIVRPRGFLGGSWTDGAEEIAHGRFLWFCGTIALPRSVSELVQGRRVLYLFLYATTGFILPVIVLAGVGYPFLVDLEAWWRTGGQPWLHEQAQWAWPTIDSSKPLWLHASDLGALSMYFVVAAQTSPSLTLTLLVGAALWVMMVSLTGIHGHLARKKISDSLREVLKVKRFERFFGGRFFNPAYERRIVREILSSRLREAPPLRGRARMPRLCETCECIQYCEDSSFEAHMKERFVAWVLGCQDGDKGFGPVPGAPATVFHTGTVLRMLHSQGLVTQGERQTWIQWANITLVRLLRDLPHGAPAWWLSDVAALAELIELLDATDCVPIKQRRKLRSMVLYQWQQSRKTPRDTICCVSAVAVFWGGRERTLQVIREFWLPEYERLLPRMDPRHRAEDIEALLRILRYMYPNDYRDRTSVQQVRDNLSKAYGRLGLTHFDSRTEREHGFNV